MLTFPPSVPADAQSLIRGLLIKDPKIRLGSSKFGANAVKRHAFFHGIDWVKTARRAVPSPWIPTFGDELSKKASIHYFDRAQTALPVNSPRVQGDALPSPSPNTARALATFEGFSYTDPGLMNHIQDTASFRTGIPSAVYRRHANNISPRHSLGSEDEMAIFGALEGMECCDADTEEVEDDVGQLDEDAALMFMCDVEDE
jgi:hypothetical protein